MKEIKQTIRSMVKGAYVILALGAAIMLGIIYALFWF